LRIFVPGIRIGHLFLHHYPSWCVPGDLLSFNIISKKSFFDLSYYWRSLIGNIAGYSWCCDSFVSSFTISLHHNPLETAGYLNSCHHGNLNALRIFATTHTFSCMAAKQFMMRIVQDWYPGIHH